MAQSESQYSLNSARIKKIKQIFIVFWVCFFVIILRLFYLQIEKFGLFSSLGERNFLKTELVPSQRGNLLDCNGLLLAANRPVFDLYWQGCGSNGLLPKHREMLDQLSFIVSSTFTEPTIIRQIERAERNTHRVLLKRDMDFASLCQVYEQFGSTPNLLVENRFKRIYPFKSLASHVLGYLNRVENSGKSGVELLFQESLKGESGYVTHVINSRGKQLACKALKGARPGSDIKLTLDLSLQNFAETLFDPSQSGAFILMESDTGAIRACVSYPNFDPNIFLRSISEDEWQEQMSVNNPLLNRICNAEYPPASPFKLVTFTAGLEEKIIDTTTEITCRGYVQFGERKHFCMRHSGHGKLTPKEALAVSCNIPCYEIAKKIKIDRIAHYARCFGLGSKTDFLLPERAGLVPTTTWKLAAKGERWWKGETLSASIGQSFLSATPLQMARMVASIGTGFLVKPRILEAEEIKRERLEISQQTLRFLREAMKEAVNSGTVQILRSLKDFDVYAKTGTGQTCSLSKKVTSRSQLEHAWITGFFTYKGGRPLTMIVLVEHAGTSRPALIIANKFLRGFKLIEESKNSAAV